MTEKFYPVQSGPIWMGRVQGGKMNAFYGRVLSYNGISYAVLRGDTFEDENYLLCFVAESLLRCGVAPENLFRYFKGWEKYS